MSNIFIRHHFIKLNNIDSETDIKLKNLNILSFPLHNKVVKKTDNELFIIKFYKYYQINNLVDKDYDFFDKNNFNYKYFELFIILDYLNHKLEHPYFLDYIGLINIHYYYQHNRDITSLYNVGIVMKCYQTLSEYLDINKTLDTKNFIKNIYNIVDLSIYLKNKYEIYHGDIKIDNIVVNDNKYYLIDWGIIMDIDEIYDNKKRPLDGNTEMYPHYNVTSEQFFIYSIGILMVRILGWNYGIKYTDFIQSYTLSLILEKIPREIISIFEELIYDICNNKIENIYE
jgi:serine/threonine protein kinase